MRKIVLAVIGLSITSAIYSQPVFYDTAMWIGKVAQGAVLPFYPAVYNPDSAELEISLEHICGCTQFEKSRYTIGPQCLLNIPVAYNSSGNSGQVTRGFYAHYNYNGRAFTQKISFEALVDSVKPWTTPAIDTGTCFRFDHTELNYGHIAEGEHVKFVYTLYNCSQKPLVIQNVQSSCGCVVPMWPKVPIPPGGTGEISAMYNSTGRPGYFTKSLAVYIGKEYQILTLKGVVYLNPANANLE